MASDSLKQAPPTNILKTMADSYGDQGGRRVFYSTSNARGMNPGKKRIPKMRIKQGGK